jgi:hypothetical protein
MRWWLVALMLVPTLASADAITALANDARQRAQDGNCEAAAASLAELERLDPVLAAAVRGDPAWQSCAHTAPATPRPPRKRCTPVYFELTGAYGVAEHGDAKIKAGFLALGYETAPESCPAPTNLRAGIVFGLTNQVPGYVGLGAELELLRWYDGLGYYGLRASALREDSEVIASLGIRLHTTAQLAVGVDFVWDSSGPTETSRTGGESSTYGVQGVVGFRGRTGLIVLGIATVLGFAFGSATSG